MDKVTGLRVWCPFKIALLVAVLLPDALMGQDQSRAPDDLDYTKSYIEENGVACDVRLSGESLPEFAYQYERRPHIEKLILPKQIFERRDDGIWLKTDDWGKLGEPVDRSETSQLDQYESIPNHAFQVAAKPNDMSQGGTVWRFVDKQEEKNVHYFRYERTRERPRPDGIYPQFTFISWDESEDGQLLLTHFEAPLYDEAGHYLIAKVDYHFKNVPPEELKYETWITGEVFSKDHVLFFKTDKPVKGNSQGNVVLLGFNRSVVNVFAPECMEAAEQHKRLRLYGILVPSEGKMPNVKRPLPNVQFIIWKMHLPGEPDELPGYEKVLIRAEDRVPGYDVKIVPHKKDVKERKEAAPAGPE